MIPWEEFREYVQRLKAERWAAILASEPPGPALRRRPRDPELEAIIAEEERRRAAERESLSKPRGETPPPSE